MGFAVTADAYDRFMGRFSRPLAAVFADMAGVDGGAVLDVGCGPGALTDELVRRGARVRAVDPAPGFVEAVRARHPGVDVLEASAEALPFPDGAFDAALAQLVVHFMAEPAAGLAEMVRVTRRGGTVAACVWDHALGPLSVFWQAVASLHEGDGPPPGEASRAGQHRGDLERLLLGAGLVEVEEAPIATVVRFEDVASWWAPFELGVGPAGDHVSGLDAQGRALLAARCRELLPPAPFDVTATAWSARGIRH
ncbi:class I SAM-dependent methyltransferase [Agrococcus carbonis]|uniref:Methyltransferase domain-containing protein n=1 Tax=Agrococcus carbonis TaxID=684552 RepID=A0A1H1LHD8_9MICO|nr:class I SAM-dependent methyltransferase [Agrococcus carbonis]SDR73732.1 Methyltransferase domain-containing protein [Agrococcus carbonis]